jgi:hypothetical protein
MRGCSICAHSERATIEQLHIEGNSLRAIAQRFPGVSPWSLRRHFQHLPDLIEKVNAHQLERNAASAKLPDRIEELIEEARAVASQARKKGHFSAAVSGLRLHLAALQTLGALSGELGRKDGEFIPPVMGADVLPAAAPRDPRRVVELIREFYGLSVDYEANRSKATGVPAAPKDPPVM